ncbi:Sodium/hydrogen exchanger family-domain-containing protein [Scleroderma yunnanense]
MPALSDTAIQLFGRFTKRLVQGQGGLLNGQDPTAFNTSDPLRLWIIQVGVIIAMSQLLSLGLRRIKQPRVISEVLGGILLGPTAFGRIPGFTQHIFPSQSIPYLTLVANIGLCFFLFIIGLEIDAGVIKRNARLSIIVSLAGVILPFGIGSAISIPIYNHFIGSSVYFPYFMLFVGVTYSITAFPVLCRILTELKLLNTTVGLIVLSAGVANDVIAWTLLALSVALVNASSGLTALWTFLVCVGYSLILLFPVRKFMLWLARKTGSTVHGPTMFYMTVVMLVLWASAFFTDIVGVNAIFGAFLAGVIIPREGGLAISLTEKLEDMITIVFLPLYFTLSGLKTNLGLLNDASAWGFVFVIAALDFSGKVTGCTLSSRYLGFTWRESGAVGALMSCKGLVELIVLNVGLSAGILNQKVFSMFVFEALLLTFMTTPIVNVLYPPERRTRPNDFNGTEISTPSDHKEYPEDDQASLVVSDDFPRRRRFTVVLDSFDNMPGIMALTQLVVPLTDSTNAALAKNSELQMDALRLIELSDRTSAVMKSSVADTLISTDPLLSVFKMFGEQRDITVSTSLAVVPYDDLANSVADHVRRHASQIVLVPWLPPTVGSSTSGDDVDTLRGAKIEYNPFDHFFGTSSKPNKPVSAIQSQFIRSILAQNKRDVAVFVDKGDRTGTSGPQHILCPFFGGPDDRLALDLVVQLCMSSRITATIVKMTKRSAEGASLQWPGQVVVDDRAGAKLLATVHEHQGINVTSSLGFPETVYGPPNTQSRLQSETADSVSWGKYTRHSLEKDVARLQLRAALSRITFEEASSPIPLQALIHCVQQLRETHRRVLVVTGRSRRMAVEDHHQEVKAIAQKHGYIGGGTSGSFELMKKTIGDVGCAFLISDVPNAMVVVQAGEVSIDDA